MDHNYQASSRLSTQNMNKYWIPHKDIHKKVITTHIQFYLGSDATVRSYTKDGEDGFLITTPGACLTDEQIDDICIKSMDMWERQAAARMLASDGNSASSSSTSPKAKLKRPLHQPVIIARAKSRMSGSLSSDGRSRRSSTHAHRNSSSISSPSSPHHHHHNHHNHNHSGHSHSHGYSRPQQHLSYPRQLPQTQQQQQTMRQQHEVPQQQPAPQQHAQQFYAQQHHYHHRPTSSHSQRITHSYQHNSWLPLSPAQDGLRPDYEGQY